MMRMAMRSNRADGDRTCISASSAESLDILLSSLFFVAVNSTDLFSSRWKACALNVRYNHLVFFFLFLKKKRAPPMKPPSMCDLVVCGGLCFGVFLGDGGHSQRLAQSLGLAQRLKQRESARTCFCGKKNI